MLGQKLLLNPCIAKNCVGKVGLVFSLIHTGCLCPTHEAVTMAARKVNVSEPVLSTTYIET